MPDNSSQRSKVTRPSRSLHNSSFHCNPFFGRFLAPFSRTKPSYPGRTNIAWLAQSVERETLIQRQSQGCGFKPHVGLAELLHQELVLLFAPLAAGTMFCLSPLTLILLCHSPFLHGGELCCCSSMHLPHRSPFSTLSLHQLFIHQLSISSINSSTC